MHPTPTRARRYRETVEPAYSGTGKPEIYEHIVIESAVSRHAPRTPQTTPMKPRPETDFARRRRLIIGPALPVPPSPVSQSSPRVWPSAPIRPDLAAPVVSKSPRLRVSKSSALHV